MKMSITVCLFLNPNLHAVFAFVMLKSNTLLATTSKKKKLKLDELYAIAKECRQIERREERTRKSWRTWKSVAKNEKISNKKNTKTISSEQDFADTVMQITQTHAHDEIAQHEQRTNWKMNKTLNTETHTAPTATTKCHVETKNPFQSLERKKIKLKS